MARISIDLKCDLCGLPATLEANRESEIDKNLAKLNDDHDKVCRMKVLP